MALHGVEADVQFPGDLGVSPALETRAKTSFSLGVSWASSEASLLRSAASSSFSAGKRQTRPRNFSCLVGSYLNESVPGECIPSPQTCTLLDFAQKFVVQA